MKKIFWFLVFAVIIVTTSSNIVFAKAGCTVLTKNLSYGSTNSNSGDQVTPLQNFLYSSGFLSTSATGRFGNLTVAAVKKFQSTQNINAIGVVGPATRAMIQKISCSVSAGDNIPVVSATSNVNAASTTLCPNGMTLTSNCMTVPGSVSGIAPVSTSSSANNLISTPSIGTQLTIGQKYLIQWTGSNNQSIISVLLKDQNGVGAGWVSGNLLGTTNNYNWTVGNVSIAGQQSAVVPPGNYQLNIIDTASYGSTFNIKSGIFSIAEAPLYLVHILPTTILADGKTTVVLYGSGFNSLTRVTLVGPSWYNPVITPQFISSDGSFIWFYVPQYITAGQYQVSVYNDYSSSGTTATSTPSNPVTLQVNQATQ